jgi:cytoskeletal protein RodZ
VRDGYPTGRHATGAIPWLAAGALIVVAVFGIAFAVLLTGNSSPAGPSHNPKPQAVDAVSPVATPSPTPSPSPAKSMSSHKPAPKTSHSASGPVPAVTSQPPSSTPRPTHKPPKPTPPPATVQLTATVSVWSHSSGSSGTVLFEVNDTGTAATGQVTVTITLPAGASMTSGGGGGGDVSRSSTGWNGWSCQATSTGATCTNAGISAGNPAWGVIDFVVSGSPVCGQLVDLTATSGSASTNAQSSVGC